jgi:hypothetical protein
MTGYNWELYNVQEDPTESNDLAAQMPGKVKELQALFYEEARRYNVLPLDNTTLTRWVGPKPSLTAGRTVFTYSGTLSGIPLSAAPKILDKEYTITADVTVPRGGAQGMIVTQGGRFGGYGLFLSLFKYRPRPRSQHFQMTRSFFATTFDSSRMKRSGPSSRRWTNKASSTRNFCTSFFSSA